MRKKLRRILALATAMFLVLGTIPAKALANGSNPETDASAMEANTTAVKADVDVEADVDTDFRAETNDENGSENAIDSDALEPEDEEASEPIIAGDDNSDAVEPADTADDDAVEPGDTDDADVNVDSDSDAEPEDDSEDDLNVSNEGNSGDVPEKEELESGLMAISEDDGSSDAEEEPLDEEGKDYSISFNEGVRGDGDTWVFNDEALKVTLAADRDMLLYSGKGLNRNNSGYIRNQDYPWGQDVTCEITDIEITEGQDIITLHQWEDENGWDIESGENIGEAEVTVTYDVYCDDDTLATGLTGTISVTVAGDVYGVDVWTRTGTDQVLPGNTIELEANGWWNRYDEENGHYEGDTSNWTYEWEIRDGKEHVTVQDSEEDSVLTLTANEDSLDVGVEVTVYVKNSDGDIAASNNYGIWITGGYHQLFVMDSEGDRVDSFDLQVGQSVELTPVLYWFDEENPDGTKVTGNVFFRWEDWNEEILQVKNEEGNSLTWGNEETEEMREGTSFTITKLNNDWTDARIEAFEINEDGDAESSGDIWVSFAGQNYDVWFEDGVREDGWTWVFTDEELPLVLNTENLAGQKNVSIILEAGTWNDDDFEVIEEFSRVSDISGEKITFLLDGAELSELDGTNAVRARVIVTLNDGTECEMEKETIGIKIKEPYASTSAHGEWEAVPGDSAVYGDTVTYRVKNQHYPYGEEFELKITNITVSDDNILKIDDSGEDIWVTVLEAGIGKSAEIRIETYSEEFGAMTLTDTITVVDRKPVLNVYLDFDRNQLLPGETVPIKLKGYLRIYDSETGEINWYAAEKYDLSYRSDNEDCVTVDENGILTANDNNIFDGAGIYVSGTMVINGETIELEETFMYVEVVEEYYYLTRVEYILAPGESIDIDDLREAGMVYLRYSIDNPDGVEVEGVTYLFDNGETTWTVPEDEKDTSYYVIVQIYNENGDELNMCRGGVLTICNHEWNDGEVTKEPTSEEAGEKTFTCEKCGLEKTEEIDMLVNPEDPVEDPTIKDPTKDPAVEDPTKDPVEEYPTKNPTVKDPANSAGNSTETKVPAADGISESTSSNGSANTGDTNSMGIVMIYLVLALAAATGSVFFLRRRKTNK